MTRLRTLIKEILSNPKKKDCGCGCNKCGDKAPILTEGKFKSLISEGLQHHIDKKISLFESVYRIGSDKHLGLIREARALWIRGIIEVSDDDKGLLETHLGHFGLYEGVEVPLDLPMVNEEKELKKGDKIKLKLKNGKEFEVTFDSYSKTDGIGYMKYIDKDGDPVRGTFSLNSIVSGKINENNLLKQAKLSSEEYQKAKKLKDFNKDDYEWNSTESLYVKEKKSKFKKAGEASGFDMRGLKEEDDDEPTASQLKSEPISKIGYKLADTNKEMKSVVKKWKDAEGAEKIKLTDRLRELTKMKKELESLL